ncbi:MAG: stage II sporulation protein P [Clostridia bacterium]|nr:stage II sporulation protein P [Clostridia bacterium]
MKHSKDFKLILFILAFDLIMVSVLSIIAFHKYGGARTSASDNKTVIRSDNVGNVLFNDSGRLNIGSEAQAVTPGIRSTSTPSHSEATAEPTQEPTPEPEYFNYFSFRFDENGYTSVKLPDDPASALEKGAEFVNIKESKFIIPPRQDSLYIGNINIENNYVAKELPLADIFSEPLKLKRMKRDSSNQFVVFYTHTYEGYCLTEEDQLHEKRWYTSEDNETNVVAAGTAFYSVLKSKGINGVNNLTVHNDGYDALKSYDYSLVTLKSEIAANPDTLLTVDVHRNGYGSLYKGKLYGPTAELDGEKYAKIMFVIGLDYDSETGTYSYETNPYWKENFKLVFLLLEKLEEKVPGITSGIALRRTPYNQGEAPNALLAELGFEGNLVSEAQKTSSLLAEIIAEIYS